MKENQVAQSSPAFRNPMDCSPPGFSIHGIFQAWALEWVAISFSRGSSQPSNWIRVSCIADRHLTIWTTRESNPVNKLLTHTHTEAYTNYYIKMGLPMWLSGKECTCQCGKCGFTPWVGKIPWSRKWQPTPGILPGKSHGQRSLMGHIPSGSQRVGHDLRTKPQQGLYKCLLYQLNEFSPFRPRFQFLVPCLTQGKHIIHICGVDKSMNEKHPALCSEAPSTEDIGSHLPTCDLHPAWLRRGLCVRTSVGLHMQIRNSAWALWAWGVCFKDETPGSMNPETAIGKGLWNLPKAGLWLVRSSLKGNWASRAEVCARNGLRQSWHCLLLFLDFQIQGRIRVSLLSF